MSPSRRMVRINELLLRELAQLCEELVVPQFSALLTLTKVEASPDLHDAIVFISVMGSDAQRDEAMHLMHENRKQMQVEINRRLTLKYTPRLHFRADHTAERADHVLGILRELNLPEEEPTAPTPPP